MPVGYFCWVWVFSFQRWKTTVLLPLPSVTSEDKSTVIQNSFPRRWSVVSLWLLILTFFSLCLIFGIQTLMCLGFLWISDIWGYIFCQNFWEVFSHYFWTLFHPLCSSTSGLQRHRLDPLLRLHGSLRLCSVVAFFKLFSSVVQFD